MSRLQHLNALLDDGLTEFGALDLGTSRDEYGCCPISGGEKQKKVVRYPEFRMHDFPGDPMDFPEEGEATIKFKTTERAKRKGYDGKMNKTVSIEVTSIDPGKAKDLSALIAATEFTDPRPRNPQGVFVESSEAGTNPDTMRKAYTSDAGRGAAMLKKLRRKLPRYAMK